MFDENLSAEPGRLAEAGVGPVGVVAAGVALSRQKALPLVQTVPGSG